MPDTKISGLTAATAVAAGDLIEVVQGGTNKQAALSLIDTLLNQSDPNVVQTFVDDFIFGSTETGEIGELNWQFLNGSVISNGGLQNRPGIMRRSSGTTIAQVASLYPMAQSLGLVRLSEIIDSTWIIFLQTAGADFALKFGFLDRLDIATPTNGVYVEREAADTAWFANVRSAGVSARTTTAVSVAASTWFKFRLRRISDTSWGFTVNGGTEIVVTTGVPAAATMVTPGLIITPTTTTARSVDIDFFSMRLQTSGR